MYYPRLKSRNFIRGGRLDKPVAQARVVQTPMAAHLRPGFPMERFVGFAPPTEPVLEADPAIAAMTTCDLDGGPVFCRGPAKAVRLFPIGGQGTRVPLWLGAAVPAFGILVALPTPPGQGGPATRELAR